MGNQEETGEELEGIQGGGTLGPGTNPTELDDDYGQPVKLNPGDITPKPIKDGPRPTNSK